MNISSINSNINSTQPEVRPKEAPKKERSSEAPSFGALELKDKEFFAKSISWLGDDFTSAMQRGVSGATALMTQPFFDWNNKNTDEETRKTSTARILGKIISGTLTGVSIRWACIKAIENFCKTEDSETVKNEKAKAKALEKHKTYVEKPIDIKPINQWLLPIDKKHATYREVKKYKNAIGTFAAVFIMIATNFLIDVPLTTMMTNFFNKRFHRNAKPADQQSVEGGK